MNRKITAAILLLLCICLDSIFFTRVHFMDIRPDAMLAATVSFAVLSGSVSGAVFGLVGGLLLDILVGRYVGLSAALYLLCGLAGGFFYKKFYADNIVVPAVTAAACGLLKDIILSVVALLAGARYAYTSILVRVVLPSALLTGVLCILIHLVLKPVLARQVKRSPSDKLPARDLKTTTTGKDSI